ncbi:nitroreductase family protein [Nocardia sp. BMG111209]|uniref:nitroreductase family protein n=1 Tax=Nocardia sp. BMG111209 TaxID=1160137 RepID=UPI00035CEB1C|nr:nitroreductase family protein [Nocardia sp. BMG111209]
MDADTLLTTTRSVRRKLDLDRPVEPDILTDCLRIAQQAPIAGAFAAGFRWLVVDDQDTKDQLAPIIRADGEKSFATYGAGLPPRTLASGRHLLATLERIPVYVIACLRGRPTGDHALLTAFYGSVYPAVWSLQLALRSRGLGSTIVGYHLAGHESDVARILGIPPEVTQVSMLAVGHTTTGTFRPGARPPVEEITYRNRWGATA